MSAQPVKHATFAERALPLADLAPVFPLIPNDKRPLLKGNGVYDATRDEALIRAWSKRAPRANVGIAMGHGLIGIDEDTYKGADLAAALDNPPPTRRAHTPSGGLHHIYRYAGELPCVNEGVLGPGICVKGKGGYLVGAGSVIDAMTYGWVDERQPFAELPERIAQLIRAAVASKPVERNGERVFTNANIETARAKWLAEALEHARRGFTRNDTGLWLACQLRDDGLDENDAEILLLEYAAAIGSDGSHPYSPREAVASLAQAYKRPPREPARSAKVTPIRRPAKDDMPAEVDEEPAPAMKVGKAEKRPLTKELADAIASAGEHFATDVAGALWIYRDGVYQRQGEAIVKQRVKSLLVDQMGIPQSWTRRQSEEVIEFIRVDAPLLWERPPLDRINLQNGILDLRSGKLHPHSPEFLSPIQLPITHDADATCPAIDTFVAQTFPDDSRHLAYEIAAALMTPDTSIQQAILLTGPGGSGKSRFLALMKAFIGYSNVSAVALHSLETDRFAPERLYGRLANICADLSSEALAGTSMFKAITGGDLIQAEAKYRTSFSFQAYARLLFSANTPPRSPDSSQGFYDRWLVIPFDRRFRGEDTEIRQRELDARLSTPAELSGLLNKALAALPGVRAHGYCDSATTRAALAEFRSVTDPFAIWLMTHTEQDPEAVVPCTDLQKAYAEYAIANMRTPPSTNSFTRLLGTHVPQVEKKQRTVNGAVTWCYLGIRLASEPTRGPGKSSQLSQLSQHFPYPYSSHAHGEMPEAGVSDSDERDKGKEKPVKPVKAVRPDASPLPPADVQVTERLRPTKPPPCKANPHDVCRRDYNSDPSRCKNCHELIPDAEIA